MVALTAPMKKLMIIILRIITVVVEYLEAVAVLIETAVVKCKVAWLMKTRSWKDL